MTIEGGCLASFCLCCPETHTPLRWEADKDGIFGALEGTWISTPLKKWLKWHTPEAAIFLIWVLKWRDTDPVEKGRKGKKGWEKKEVERNSPLKKKSKQTNKGQIKNYPRRSNRAKCLKGIKWGRVAQGLLKGRRNKIHISVSSRQPAV